MDGWMKGNIRLVSMYATNLATYKVILCKQSGEGKKTTPTSELMKTWALKYLCQGRRLVFNPSGNCWLFAKPQDSWFESFSPNLSASNFMGFTVIWNKVMSEASSALTSFLIFLLSQNDSDFITKKINLDLEKALSNNIKERKTSTKYNLLSGTYTRSWEHVRQQKGGSHWKLHCRAQKFIHIC